MYHFQCPRQGQLKRTKTPIRCGVLLQLCAKKKHFFKKLLKLVIEPRLRLCKIILNVTVTHVKVGPYNLR